MTHDLIGSRIGPYAITDFEGGDETTEVFLGYDTTNENPVTITLVGRSAEGEERSFSSRFRREARAVASLDHPNIVKVLDFGQVEGGYYMVRGDVSGSTLAETLAMIRNEGRMPDLYDLAFVFRQVSAALDYAHQNGVVHKSVTPGAIVITRSGQALLADFGLTLLYSDPDDSSLEVLVGPAEYKAPEVLSNPANASIASDIYALGVILYEMLTGLPPYIFGSNVDMALRELQETAPDPRLLNEDISPTVAMVVLKALAHEPKDRFKSAMAFANALERSLRPGSQVADIFPPDPQTKPAETALPPYNPGVETLAHQPAVVLEENKAVSRAAIINTLAVIATVVVLGLGATYMLNRQGIVDIPFFAQLTDVSVGDSGDETPTLPSDPPEAATFTPAPLDGSPDGAIIPTQTISPSPTPLQVEDGSTPVPEPEVAELAVGTTAFRLVDGAPMQFVPEGVFLMGTDDPARNANAKPQHSVMLTDYWIDRNEVTNVQYARCVAAGVCKEPFDTRYFEIPARYNHPVTYVQYNHALSYCLWLSTETEYPVGLPSEAQWEKAAAWDPVNQVALRFPWGDGPVEFDKAVYVLTTRIGTEPGGTFPLGASPYGINDMAGNVWEWVADWFDYDTYQRDGVVIDPAGPENGDERVIRGGGWANEERLLVSSIRTAAQPLAAGGELGFRCAMNVRRPGMENGVYMTPLDLIGGLNMYLDSVEVTSDREASVIQEARLGLAAAASSMQANDNGAATSAMEDLLATLEIARENGTISRDTLWQLRSALAWMIGQIAPPGEG